MGPMKARTMLLLAALAALLAFRLPSAPAAEPLWLGDDGDSVAVLALVPGDEMVYAAGVLLECLDLDLPAHVYFFADDPSARLAADEAAEALADAAGTDAAPPLTFLADPTTELPARLAAQHPTYLIVSPEFVDPASPLPDALAAIPDALPLAAIPPDDPAPADYEFELVDTQLEAKTAALEPYGLSDPAPVERFARVNLAPRTARQPAPGTAEPIYAPPPAENTAIFAPAPAPAPAPIEPATPAQNAPAPTKNTRHLVPRASLPALPPPRPSGLDAPVVW